MDPNRNRAAIYVATFTKRNNLKNSIEHQIERCKEQVLRSGLELIDIYIDEAANSEDLERPSLQRLFVDARDDALDWVIVTDYKKYSPKHHINYAVWNLLRSYRIGTLTAPEPKKPKSSIPTFEVPEFKFSAQTLAQFDVLFGEKTLEEYEAEFGPLRRDTSESQEDSGEPES